MGLYTPITVAFCCDNQLELTGAARDFLNDPVFPATGDPELDAVTPDIRADVMGFATAMAGLEVGSPATWGPKGAMITWGWVGNYGNGRVFAVALSEFWWQLYQRGAIEEDACILITWCVEQRGRMELIRVKNAAVDGKGGVTIEGVEDIRLSFWDDAD